jgi:hypothetical protein
MKRKDANEDEEDVRAAPKHWNQAKARFCLTREELAMDETARGRKIKRRSLDKLPLHETAAQVKKVKHEIRERYACLFGEVPLPPVEASRAKKSERAQYESHSMTQIIRPQPRRACRGEGLHVGTSYDKEDSSEQEAQATTLPHL